MRWIALACLFAGCSSSSDDLKFPKGFLFGSATAGFQVEMGCPTVAAAECEDRNSDWYQWITSPDLIGDSTLHISGEAPSDGPGFYELYEGDLDRVANELHHNGFRLSIEWSRVFPTATDGVEGHDALKAIANPKALAYYHALFAAMKARGITPLVTINHYVLPSWIDDAVACHKDLDTCMNKGWADTRVVGELAKYAGFLAEEFGGEVDRWATLNEPLTAVVLAGFLFQTAARSNPPGVFLNAAAAKAAFVNMIEAHAKMYDAVKMNDTVDADGDGVAAQVGIVYNLEPVVPDDPTNPTDVQAAKNADYLINQAFLDGLGPGRLDANLDGKPTMKPELANKLDFLGINYYARLTVQGSESSFFPDISPLLTFNPIALKYDYGYPRGIYEELKWATRYKVPLVITETGVDNAGNDGTAASQWIVETLHWVKRAINDGVKVEGYFYWTLMDNYEWNHGMTVKMGLYAVDPTDKTKARTARPAVAVYGQIASTGAIPPELAAKYPIK